jgi:hypothetical protein
MVLKSLIALQTLSKAFASAKEQIARSLLK